jgi:predicted RNA-binding protein with PIN domain
MHYLIDGYNLLHAMGVMRGRLGPGGLEKARLRLLGLLKGSYGADAGRLAVVFDGAGAPAGVPETEIHEDIRVYYAVHEAQADDLIESFIGHESTPRQLTVVSDDHRLRDAARKRHCAVLGCYDFLEHLDRRGKRRHGVPRPADEKPSGGHEAEHWLQEFAGIEEQREFKDFLRMDRFDDDKPPEGGRT